MKSIQLSEALFELPLGRHSERVGQWVIHPFASHRFGGIVSVLAATRQPEH
jgi:hypothetical protein